MCGVSWYSSYSFLIPYFTYLCGVSFKTNNSWPSLPNVPFPVFPLIPMCGVSWYSCCSFSYPFPDSLPFVCVVFPNILFISLTCVFPSFLACGISLCSFYSHCCHTFIPMIFPNIPICFYATQSPVLLPHSSLSILPILSYYQDLIPACILFKSSTILSSKRTSCISRCQPFCFRMIPHMFACQMLPTLS